MLARRERAAAVAADLRRRLCRPVHAQGALQQGLQLVHQRGRRLRLHHSRLVRVSSAARLALGHPCAQMCDC